jgi:LAO/AO transport system kinase
METNKEDLVAGMLAGSQSSLARLITIIDSDSPDVTDIMSRITPYLGKAYRIGITGAAGVGKSTLASALAVIARNKGLSVGIVATDPSSVIHGGAVLGDRIRMQQHFLNSEVFIRSMATRGSQSGLSKNIGNVIKLLDAFGKDIIMVETVGVGQTETGISEVVDTVVLVLSPESGDSIEFMKVGLVEIADVIVVNKADRGHAENLVSELVALFSLRTDSERHNPAVLTTQAINNIGIEELYQELENRQKAIKSNRQSR